MEGERSKRQSQVHTRKTTLCMTLTQATEEGEDRNRHTRTCVQEKQLLHGTERKERHPHRPPERPERTNQKKSRMEQDLNFNKFQAGRSSFDRCIEMRSSRHATTCSHLTCMTLLRHRIYLSSFFARYFLLCTHTWILQLSCLSRGDDDRGLLSSFCSRTQTPQSENL